MRDYKNNDSIDTIVSNVSNNIAMYEKQQLILEVKNLCVNFPVKGGLPFSRRKYVEAVTDVSFKVFRGETLGVVGESGCGKTTLGNAVLGMIKPSSGTVIFKGQDINKATGKDFAHLRRDMQMIFQDPYSSLNPRFDVYDIISEPFVIRGGYSKTEIMERVMQLLKQTGLDERDLYRNASDFSGGQRQRLGIARAIALAPEFIVCDEPVSALDVSVHAQILNLLMDLQKEMGLTYMFISHNLAVVKNVCDSLIVMYMGKIVEMGPTADVFDNPVHPYTKALLSAVPDIDAENQKERVF
ncbi:MAG: ATP-binding cassette domain-containing protein [Eubacteriales bacterium]|nr:ATP-binding cassette domain-containing protein [Eubacteriales bacterium]